MQDKYNFNENETEYSKKDNGYIPVVKTPKYIETKKKVIDMLEEGTYKGLNESYFWILMNRTGSGKMAYTGLIISHDGMKIINDNLPNKVNPRCFSQPTPSIYGDGGMYMTYTDDETFEIGEVSKTNCLNAYPYAMLHKRCYDRAVKDKAKMYGVYSESEADEFKEKIEEIAPPKNEDDEVDIFEMIRQLYSKDEVAKMLEHYNIQTLEELDLSVAIKYIQGRTKRK